MFPRKSTKLPIQSWSGPLTDPAPVCWLQVPPALCFYSCSSAVTPDNPHSSLLIQLKESWHPPAPKHQTKVFHLKQTGLSDTGSPGVLLEFKSLRGLFVVHLLVQAPSAGLHQRPRVALSLLNLMGGARSPLSQSELIVSDDSGAKTQQINSVSTMPDSPGRKEPATAETPLKHHLHHLKHNF